MYMHVVILTPTFSNAERFWPVYFVKLIKILYWITYSLSSEHVKKRLDKKWFPYHRENRVTFVYAVFPMNISASNLAIDTQGCYSCKQTPSIERICRLKAIHPAGEWKKVKEKCVSTRRGDACIDFYHSHSIPYFNYFDNWSMCIRLVISTMLYYCNKMTLSES